MLPFLFSSTIFELFFFFFKWRCIVDLAKCSQSSSFPWHIGGVPNLKLIKHHILFAPHLVFKCRFFYCKFESEICSLYFVNSKSNYKFSAFVSQDSPRLFLRSESMTTPCGYIMHDRARLSLSALYAIKKKELVSRSLIVVVSIIQKGNNQNKHNNKWNTKRPCCNNNDTRSSYTHNKKRHFTFSGWIVGCAVSCLYVSDKSRSLYKLADIIEWYRPAHPRGRVTFYLVCRSKCLWYL